MYFSSTWFEANVYTPYIIYSHDIVLDNIITIV